MIKSIFFISLGVVAVLSYPNTDGGDSQIPGSGIPEADELRTNISLIWAEINYLKEWVGQHEQSHHVRHGDHHHHHDHDNETYEGVGHPHHDGHHHHHENETYEVAGHHHHGDHHHHHENETYKAAGHYHQDDHHHHHIHDNETYEGADHYHHDDHHHHHEKEGYSQELHNVVHHHDDDHAHDQHGKQSDVGRHRHSESSHGAAHYHVGHDDKSKKSDDDNSKEDQNSVEDKSSENTLSRQKKKHWEGHGQRHGHGQHYGHYPDHDHHPRGGFSNMQQYGLIKKRCKACENKTQEKKPEGPPSRGGLILQTPGGFGGQTLTLDQQPNKIADEVYMQAYCNVKPNLEIQESKVHGNISIFQKSFGRGPVYFKISLRGFNTGKDEASRTHGFHIHEKPLSKEGNDCNTAGAHYNPTGSVHGSLYSTERHLGDLGNIVADLDGQIEEYCLTNNENKVADIVAKSFVVHELPDDLGIGGNAESLTTGNAGRRLACCTIHSHVGKVIRFNG